MLLDVRSFKRIVGIVPLLAALTACGERQADKDTETQNTAYRVRYAKAKALFEERCKTAGVVIKRTVKDVDGIELLKVRPELEWGDRRYFDPMFEGAAMASEATGAGYIASFLYSEHRSRSAPDRRGQMKPPDMPAENNEEPPRKGYQYVDARFPKDAEILRYRVIPDMSDAKRRELGGYAKDLSAMPRGRISPRYAVDYEDVVSPQDRAYWIAETRVKVVDRQTGEVIAQLTRFVWDSSLGGSSTGRWPWQHANMRGGQDCPSINGDTSDVTRYFVDSVLIPKQGD